MNKILSMMFLGVILFLFLVTLSFVSSTTVDIVSNVTKGASITAVDGIYYIVCEDCSGHGVNNLVDKYIYSTDTHQDFSRLTSELFLDNQTVSGSFHQPLIYEIMGNLILFIPNNTAVNRYYMLYKYSFILDRWFLLYPYSDIGLPLSFTGASIFYNAFVGLNYSFWGQAYDAGITHWWRVFNFGPGAQTVSSYGEWGGGTGYNDRARSFFKTSPFLGFDGEVYGINRRFNKNFTTDIVDMPYYTSGWMTPDNDRFIMINGNEILYSSNSGNLSDYTNSLTLSGCNDILSLQDVVLNDLDCKDQNDCVIVGSYGTGDNIKPLAFQYAYNVGCQYIDLTNIQDFPLYNSSIYSIDYDITKGRFMFVGKNILGGILSSLILNTNLTTSNIPVCYSDQNYLCSSPLIDENGFLYCAIENTLYCNLGCDNIIFDNTIGKQFLYPKQSCNTEYSTKATYDLNCYYQTYNWIENYILGTYTVGQFELPRCILTNDTVSIPRAGCSDNDYESYYLTHPDNDIEVVGLCSTEATCLDECIFNGDLVNVNGYKECTGLNQHQTCGNYDTDACLELSSPTVCIFGKYCYGGNCVAYPQGGYEINYPLFSVSPQTNDYILYNAQTRTVTNNDPSILGIQRFAILVNTPNTTYTSQTCKYTEQLVYNRSGSININSSLETTFTNSAQDTIFTFSLTNNASIEIKDFTDALVIGLKQNSSGGQTCISFFNSTSSYEELWCATYGDFANVRYELNYYQNNNVWQLHTEISGFAGYNDQYSRPISSLSVSSLNKINIFSDNTTLSYLQIVYPKTFKPFTLTQKNNYNYLACTYTANGCYTVRTYESFVPSQTFQNYYDIMVCMNNINGEGNDFVTGEGSDFVRSIPLMWRYVIMLVVVIIFFMFPLVLAGGEGVIASLALSAVIALTLSIIFGLSLLIPIVYIIISGGIIALLIRKTVTG